MDKLTIEQKAKAYDEAIKRVRYWEKNPTVWSSDDICQKLFPELAESEDKRIKNFISNELVCLRATDEKGSDRYEELTKAINWLEKHDEQSPKNTNKECLKGIKRVQEYQDLSDWEKKFDSIASMYAHNKNQEGYNESWYVKERAAAMLYHAKKELEKQAQKPSDKVEPKFKVGDWVMLDRPVLITKVKNMPYNIHEYWTSAGTWFGDATKAKLWTIQDAKDGDVLCCESGWTCIFKALDNHTNTFSSYCFMDSDKWFCNIGCDCHSLDKAFIKAYNGEIYPATKEQRDLLFQKMHEAGYQWDAEKKELKKISQEYPLTPDEYIKSSWSEEDELHIKELESLVKQVWANAEDKDDKVTIHKMSDLLFFLKTLKPQLKQEWSKEDERIYRSIIYSFAHNFPLTVQQQVFVKSFKERYAWKPSEEQLSQLYYASNGVHYNRATLLSLLEQLKKL